MFTKASKRSIIFSYSFLIVQQLLCSSPQVIAEVVSVTSSHHQISSIFSQSMSSMLFSSAASATKSVEEKTQISLTDIPPPPLPTTGNKNILISGGAGYIASHTIVCLIEAGYDVTIIDNLVNAKTESIKRVKKITACDDTRLRFYNVDICDADALERVFLTSPKFEACIHFAGLKAVGESVTKPLLYYQNNLGSTINLLSLMDKYKCRSIVFSSSATVYGSAAVPITEDTPTGTGMQNCISLIVVDMNVNIKNILYE